MTRSSDSFLFVRLRPSGLADEHRQRARVVVVVGVDDHLRTIEVEAGSEVLGEVASAARASCAIGADGSGVHYAGCFGLRKSGNAS